MSWFRKRPLAVFAIQWTGDNADVIEEHCGAAVELIYFNGGGVRTILSINLYVAANQRWLPLQVGEWIITDELGFYPCKDAIFTKTYEPVTTL